MSTLERLRLLQTEMKEEEDEFVHSMEARLRKTKELKKTNLELGERLKAVQEEVSLVDAQLWEKEESLQILWEACRRLKRELDGRVESKGEYHKDETQRTSEGTRGATCATRDHGGAFGKVDGQQIFHKAGPQRETPMEFAPSVCSSPMPSPIKPINYVSPVSMEMESRLVSRERRAENFTGNLNRSQMLANFDPEMINVNEKRESVCRIGPVNLIEESLRKRRMNDLSDPDLQIIHSRQRNKDSDSQGNLQIIHSRQRNKDSDSQ